MPLRRLALALALVLVAASVGVGAAPPVSSAAESPATSTVNNASASPLGQNMSAFMQSNAAQAERTVGNGMWTAAFDDASNASAKRALVERRVGELNGTLAELKAERRALQDAFRNDTIDRATYRLRLSIIVGQLAALDEGIEAADDRGQAVGVDASRLDELRSQADELGGGEVSRQAGNLTGSQGPPSGSDRGPPGDESDVTETQTPTES